MVSFSLRLRISYLLLQDSSLVSFDLIQFVAGCICHIRSPPFLFLMFAAHSAACASRGVYASLPATYLR